MPISDFLKRRGVEHRFMHGSVKHKLINSPVIPHYWIELGQDIMSIVDSRLRMWLVDNNSIQRRALRWLVARLVYRGGRPKFLAYQSRD